MKTCSILQREIRAAASAQPCHRGPQCWGFGGSGTAFPSLHSLEPQHLYRCLSVPTKLTSTHLLGHCETVSIIKNKLQLSKGAIPVHEVMDDPGWGMGLTEPQISLTHPGSPSHSLQIREAQLLFLLLLLFSNTVPRVSITCQSCFPLAGADAGECPQEQGQVPAAPALGCLQALQKTLGWEFASSQLGQFPGLRPQLSILSLVLPSFHPLFPGCSCQCQCLAKLPRGLCPCHVRLHPPPATSFGDRFGGLEVNPMSPVAPL